MEKRIRFGDLVKSTGKPQTATLWMVTKKDPAFSRALRQNRVLTIVQQRPGGHQEFGIIGFLLGSRATYLVFPRTLPKNENARVIGVNRQLLDEPKAAEPAQVRTGPQRTRPVSKPAQKTFTITVRRTARVETDVRVQAANRRAAEAVVLDAVKEAEVNWQEAEIREEAVDE